MPPLGTPAVIVAAVCLLCGLLGAIWNRRRATEAPLTEAPPEVVKWDPIGPGSRFKLRSADPWPTRYGGRVVVIDTRPGWIRHRFYLRSPTAEFEQQYGDTRDRLGDFLDLYEPIGPGEI